MFDDHIALRGPSRAIVASAALHLMLLAVLTHRPDSPFLHGSTSLRGSGGRGQAIELAASGVNFPVTSSRPDEEPNRLRAATKPRRRQPKAVETRVQAAAENVLMPGMPGFVLGSVTTGFAADHDVRVAVSVVAPEPPIARSELPKWIRGDVIVEVTIDEKGNVIGTKLLQSVGFGLDEIVVATLRQWHYIPAKVDGMPVASREDVYFHFPS